MDYLYNLVKKLGIFEEEIPKFAKPEAYKNINTSYMGKK